MGKHTTAEKLYYTWEKMACMIGNMTCMLRDLDWMKEDKTPNIALYEKKINDIPGASQGLKDELMWGLDVCKDFSMCVSPNKMTHKTKHHSSPALASKPRSSS